MRAFKQTLVLVLAIGAVLLLFACAPAPEAAQPQAGPMSPNAFLMATIQFFCFALIVYFLLVINPSRRKEEDHARFIKELKKNDEVITSGGLLGRVVSVKPEAITVELGPNVRVRVLPERLSPLKVRASQEAKSTPGDQGKSANGERASKKS